MELFQILKDDAVKVLHSVCQQIWKTQQWPQDWKRSVFIPIPEKNNRMGKTRNLFKNMRFTKGTFHAKMGSIKERNGMDLGEAEDIKKRWQEYTKNY